MIDDKEIKKLAELSRLEISEAEIKELSKDMGSILAYIDKLKKAKVGKMNDQVTGQNKNQMRDDVVKNTAGEYTESLLSLAPKHEGKHVQVKKIL